MQRSTRVLLITFGVILFFFFIFIAGIVVLGMFIGGGLGGCSSQITQEIQAPDHKNVAYIIERDCGATSGSTALAIAPPGRSPTEGNVFSSENTDFHARWKGSYELIISYPKNAEVNIQKTNVNGIIIVYELTAPE